MQSDGVQLILLWAVLREQAVGAVPAATSLPRNSRRSPATPQAGHARHPDQHRLCAAPLPPGRHLGAVPVLWPEAGGWVGSLSRRAGLGGSARQRGSRAGQRACGLHVDADRKRALLHLDHAPAPAHAPPPTRPPCKQGHIRVLSRTSAVRALLKGHTQPLTDMEFAGACAEGGALLASGAQDGQLFVWQLRLDEDEAAVRDSQLLHASFVSGSGALRAGVGLGLGLEVAAAGSLVWRCCCCCCCRQPGCGASTRLCREATVLCSPADQLHHARATRVLCRACGRRVPVVARAQPALPGGGRGRARAAGGRAAGRHGAAGV